MSVAFTTEGLNEQDRIPYWVDVASKAYFDHGFNAKPADFLARLDACRLDNLMLSRCECGPCEVTRTRRDIARDGIDDFILGIRLTGRSLFSQGERRVVVDPGTVYLQDTGRPLTIEFAEPTTSVFVSIPRHEIEMRIAPGDRERVLSTTTPTGGIAAEFVQALAMRVKSIDPAVHARLASQATDLIGLAFAGGVKGAPPSSARANTLRRLKAVIEKRLSDPALKPANAAAGAGISVRYANALLAEENTSVERYILHRRLERCRRTLEDPLQVHRMIGEIAFGWGFSDHSHFTRRFRAAYGMTPADCRRRLRGNAKA
jgi:AraC family transcriptional activator of tynA and feaB